MSSSHSPSGTVTTSRTGSPTASISGTHTARWYGYVPPVAILERDTGRNVTLEWLDWRKDYLIVVYAGLGFNFPDSTLLKPPSASALLQSGSLSRPQIEENPVIISPNYIAYLLASSALNIGSTSMTLAAGALRRSDTTFNRPTNFGIRFGFIPSVYFTDGFEIDAEAALVPGSSAWFSTQNVSTATFRNATVTIQVSSAGLAISSINVSHWVADGSFYNNAENAAPLLQRMPGGLQVIGDVSFNSDALENTFDFVLDISSLPPGQYPVTFRSGLFFAKASILDSSVGNAQVTAYLKIGPTTKWRQYDAVTGAEIEGEVLDAGRDVLLSYAISVEVEGQRDTIASFADGAVAGNPGTLVPWSSLALAASSSIVTYFDSAPTYAFEKKAFTLLYAMSPLWTNLASGDYVLSDAGSGRVCNGELGRLQLCTARAIDSTLSVGFRPFASFFNGAQINSYKGALDARGVDPVTVADTPIPLLAKTFSAVFSDPTNSVGNIPAGLAGAVVAWSVAVRAPADFPAPDSVSTALGSIVYTWTEASVAAIPSGVYDIELKQGVCAGGDGIFNARSIVRLVLGFNLNLFSATTSINVTTGYDVNAAALYRRGVSGPFVTLASDALLRISGAREGGFLFSEIISSITVVSTGEILSKSVLSDTKAIATNSWLLDSAGGRRSDYALTLVGLKDGLYRIVIRNSITGDEGTNTDLDRSVLLTDAFEEEAGSREVSLLLVIARTAPVGTTALFSRSGGAFFAAGLPSGDIFLPQSLFTTSIAQPSSVLLLSIVNADTYGFALRTPQSDSPATVVGSTMDVFFSNSSLTTGPRGISGPPGTLTLSIKATDEIGNFGIANVSFSVGTPPLPTITAIDKPRNVANTSVLTLSPINGVISLSVRAVFPVAVRGASNASVRCEVGVGSGLCATMTTQAFSILSQTPAGVFAYVWDVTIGGSDVDYVLNLPSRAINLTIDGAGIYDTATLVESSSSLTVQIRVDDSPPHRPLALILELPDGSPGQFIAPLAALAGVEYFMTLPYKLFDDDFSPSRLGGVTMSIPAGTSLRGFVFNSGPLGYAHFLGTPQHIVGNRLLLALTATDVAGNTITMADAMQIPVIDSMPLGVPKLVLSAPGIDLSFIEGGAPISFDPHIDMAISGRLTRSERLSGVYVRLHSPESMPNGSDFSDSEYLVGENPCIEACVVTYEVDTYTGDGILSLRAPRTETWTAGVRGYIEIGNVTLGDVRTFLRSVRYVNSRTSIKTSGKRLIVAQVVQSIVNSLVANTEAPLAPLLNVVIASAKRVLRVQGLNHAPVIILDESAAPSTWTQSNPVGVPILLSINNITDSDDASVTSASVIISTVASSTNAACDSTRDYLQLFHTYRVSPPLPAVVYGQWYAFPCLLLLRPVPPALSVSIAEMKEALEAIVYKNYDVVNPLNWNNATSARGRRIIVHITDAGQGGLLSPATSTDVSVDLTILPQDLPFVIDRRIIFGANGVLSSPDSAAAAHQYADALGFIQQKKWPLVIPAIGSIKASLSNAVLVSNARSECRTDGSTDNGGTVVCIINLDLRAVTGLSGVFALGSISSPNNAKLSKEVNVNFLLGSTSSAGALINGVAVDLGSVSVTPELSGTFLSSSLTSSREGMYEIHFILRGDAIVDGEFILELVYALTPSRVSVQFAIDVRRSACTLPDATNFVGLAAIAAGNIYPINSDCVWPPVVISADTGGTVSRGNYDSDFAKMMLATSSMAAFGASINAQYTALASQRSAARGGFSLVISAGAILGTGSIAIEAAYASDAIAALLPTPPTLPHVLSSYIDLSVALHLGPAGLTFATPISVCLFVGDIDEGLTAFLITSSQRDPLDITKGFLPFEFLFDATFSRPLGLLCGLVSHFSVVVPFIVTPPSPPLADKARSLGSTCPTDSARRICSASGICTTLGRCQCFDGFTGVDCSLRKCPAAESWGQSEFFSETALTASKTPPFSTHIFTECAGRGACNRNTGLCSCFSGFEGGACERMSCPKKLVNTTDTFVYITKDGEAAALAELEWEAAFVAEDPKEWLGAIIGTELPCYGRGVCRLLGELPVSERAQYAPWAHTRVQKCICDAPFTGADCSQRFCPLSADILNVVTAVSSVYRLSIDFGQYPSFAQVINIADSEIALSVVFDDGRVLQRTAVISDIWAGTDTAAASIKDALKRLPCQLGESELTITPVEATDSSSLSVAYDLSSVDGFVPNIACVANPDGSMGCVGSACQPKYKQLRVLKTELPMSMSIAPCILKQPSAVTGGLTNAATPFVWGVKTSLVIDFVPLTPDAVAADPSAAVSLSGFATAVRLTYAWKTTLIYGTAMSDSDAAAADWITEATPLPPPGLRLNIVGPYGLVITMGDNDAITSDIQSTIDSGRAAPWAFDVAWRLPSCTVALIETVTPVKKFVECGNRGLCNHDTGVCQCFSGAEGPSCGRTAESV